MLLLLTATCRWSSLFPYLFRKCSVKLLVNTVAHYYSLQHLLLICCAFLSTTHPTEARADAGRNSKESELPVVERSR